ncbi:F510_1955 family glycosylhydrolase [Jeotgalibacillus sp. R-1-5s-1]|uniref:F510_1955 family glycosylhydrolase n=1 Tax=Jeotgalibacillus sp. R-1-5s-1 TaxID=2555897 RepID=UPI00106DCDA7|nr:hypothetical protein [Jeotgalibacillus sp. R-1-5s-1]TFE01845.1 hypothetical protein E2491_03485 [Jeotgalibacillus sp. R-1-5s-1]
MKKVKSGLTILAAVIMAAGCSTEESSSFYEPVDEQTGAHHVHGMDFVEGELIVATHYGLFKRDGDQWLHSTSNNHDYMGFTSFGDGFYASGHPDPSTDLENPLGLVKSLDQGESMEQLVFSGETDYHYMAASREGKRLYTGLMEGNSELDAGFYYTDDEGDSWIPMELQGLEAESLFGFAAHPSNKEELVLMTDKGLFQSTDSGKTVTLLDNSQGTTAAYFTEDGLYTVEGNLVKKDQQEIGSIDFLDEAVMYLAVNPDKPEEIFAVTGAGDAAFSSDGGETWNEEVIYQTANEAETHDDGHEH